MLLKFIYFPDFSGRVYGTQMSKRELQENIMLIATAASPILYSNFSFDKFLTPQLVILGVSV